MCNQSKLARFSVANRNNLRKLRSFGRCVAQLGSALRWGRRGRRFESYHTDQLILNSPYLNFRLSQISNSLVAVIIGCGRRGRRFESYHTDQLILNSPYLNFRLSQISNSLVAVIISCGRRGRRFGSYHTGQLIL